MTDIIVALVAFLAVLVPWAAFLSMRDQRRDRISQRCSKGS